MPRVDTGDIVSGLTCVKLWDNEISPVADGGASGVIGGKAPFRVNGGASSVNVVETSLVIDGVASSKADGRASKGFLSVESCRTLLSTGLSRLKPLAV